MAYIVYMDACGYSRTLQTVSVKSFGGQVSVFKTAFESSRWPLHPYVTYVTNESLILHQRSFIFIFFLDFHI
jgi:hypothetical protein